MGALMAMKVEEVPHALVGSRCEPPGETSLHVVLHIIIHFTGEPHTRVRSPRFASQPVA